MAASLKSTPEVDDWVATTLVMIEAASTYAAGGVWDEETEGMLRRMRVINGALMAALMQNNFPPQYQMRPPPTTPSG